MVCVTLTVTEKPITGCETNMDCLEGYRCEASVCVPIAPEIHWEWLAGIGIGTLIIGGVAYYAIKKKKRKK